MDNSGNETKEDLGGNIKKDIYDRIGRRHGSRIWVPIGLVLVGGLLLVRQMDVGLPEWLFSWPMLLIVIGIFSGLNHAFRGPGWLILIMVGTFFLLEHLIPGLDIHRFIWPAVIIVVGLIMLVRPKKPYWMDHTWQERWSQRKKKDGKEDGRGVDILGLLTQDSLRAVNPFQIRVQQEMQDQVPEVFRQKIISRQPPY